MSPAFAEGWAPLIVARCVRRPDLEIALGAGKRCVGITGRAEAVVHAAGLQVDAFLVAVVDEVPVREDAEGEALLRLLITDLVGEPATRASLTTLRDDVADLLARLDETEASAQTLPHRRKYLLLVTGFMRRLYALHLELIDQVERELDATERGRGGRAPAPD